MSCNCCQSEADPNFVVSDLMTKVGEIHAALIASASIDMELISAVLDDPGTDDLTIVEGGWKWVRVENTSASSDATVNGAVLAPGSVIEYVVPSGHLVAPELFIVGNSDGVRVDRTNW